MSPPRDKVLVVIGCGPGIGVATAALFAAHSFNKIALIARNAQRLEDYRATVLNTAKLAHFKCCDVDVTQSAVLNAVLIDVERMGQISCVLFNAARVGPSEFFDFDEEELINDFKVSKALNSSIVLDCDLQANVLFHRLQMSHYT
jgi:NAD(P)-dependent dehydrogenase (short-subunit alcohol dehydrogenase family)